MLYCHFWYIFWRGYADACYDTHIYLRRLFKFLRVWGEYLNISTLFIIAIMKHWVEQRKYFHEMNPKMCYYCLCLYTIIRIYKCTVLQCIIRVDQGNGSAEIHLTAQFIARNILGVGCFVLFVAFNLFLSLFLSFFSLVVFCSTDHLHFLLVLLLLLYTCWAPVWHILACMIFPCIFWLHAFGLYFTLWLYNQKYSQFYYLSQAYFENPLNLSFFKWE